MAILICVSDRGGLKDVSQSPQSSFDRRCKLLILKRRDAGAVDQARLETSVDTQNRQLIDTSKPAIN